MDNLRGKEKMNEEEKLKVCPLSGDMGKIFVIRLVRHSSGVKFVPVVKCQWCSEELKNV